MLVCSDVKTVAIQYLNVIFNYLAVGYSSEIILHASGNSVDIWENNQF